MQGIAAGKKEKTESGGGVCAQQGRAAVKGRESRVIGCEVLGLDLGFRKVQRERLTNM